MEADKHPVERFLGFVNAFGIARLILTLLAIAVAYLVIGNTPGRIIGAVLLVGVTLWVSRLIRRFANRNAKPS